MKCLRVLAIVVSTLTFASTGCSKGDTSYSLLAASERFLQTSVPVNNKLDILFVIADEPSMSSFQAKLVASFASFMGLFQTKGFDFKIAVITPSAYMADPTLSGYNPSNTSAADFNDFDGTTHSNMFVITPSDPDLLANFAINARPTKNTAGQDGRVFSSFGQALQSARPINTGFRRSDAFLAVVIVSNQDDFSGNGRCTGCNISGRYSAATLDPVSTYVDLLNTLTGTSGAGARYNVSAMTQIGAPCQGGSNMTRIMELAKLTNGILGDICQSDFGPSMAQMADKIAMMSSQFYLSDFPVVSSINVNIDGVTIAQGAVNGWTYDSGANSIVFHGSAIPAQGAVIGVTFDPIALSF